MTLDSVSAGPKNGAAAGKAVDDSVKAIARAMRQLMQYLDVHSRQLLKTHAVTVPQVMCLDVLRDRGTLTVAVLAEAIHLSPSTTVGIIDRLEKRKLVKRNRSNVDRRSVFVEITDAGRDFLTSAPNLLHNKLKDALRPLTRNEQTQVATSLDRLVVLLKDQGA
jgi:DNA-binding MarR family transcriptional regulator